MNSDKLKNQDYLETDVKQDCESTLVIRAEAVKQGFCKKFTSISDTQLVREERENRELAFKAEQGRLQLAYDLKKFELENILSTRIDELNKELEGVSLGDSDEGRMEAPNQQSKPTKRSKAQ